MQYFPQRGNYDLYIDQDMVFWVLFPITFVMLLSKIISSHLEQITQPMPVSSSHLIKHHSVLNLSQKFIKGFLKLTPHGFTMYQQHLLTSVDFGLSEEAGKKRQLDYQSIHGNNKVDEEEQQNQNEEEKSVEKHSNPDTKASKKREGQKNHKSSQESTSTNNPTDQTSPPNLPPSPPPKITHTASIINTDDINEEDTIDPGNLINGMFSSILSILPQMLQYIWISYFYTGVIILKLPISSLTLLPSNFKAMLHHSIPFAVSSTLPTFYISAISWYIVNMLFLSTIKSIIMDLTTRSSHSSFRALNVRSIPPHELIYQHDNGISLPKQDQFQQLNPLGGGGGGGGGTGGPQFAQDYKYYESEVKLLQYNSNTVSAAQQDLLKSWRAKRANRV